MRTLFIDRTHLGTLRGDIALARHSPIPHDPDPTAPIGFYQTLVQDGDTLYRYYRGLLPDYHGDLFDGNPGEYTAFAISHDEGRSWEYPRLNLFPGAPANAIVFGTMFTHNFVPFIDRNPACRPEERFKAVAGIVATGGLHAFHSPDGIRWREYGSAPVVPHQQELTLFAFDSQNVAFYSETEHRYLLYYRVFRNNDGNHRRSVARAESQDFIHWNNHMLLDVNRPDEHLYVSLMAPYPRKPELLVGTPTRYFDERGSATDIALVFSPDGKQFLRPFPDAWIRPGADPRRWGNRSNYLAWNILVDSHGNLNFFHDKSQIRYTLRADGFTSLAAGLDGGTWTSELLTATDEPISFNLETSAAGCFHAAILDGDSKPIPGFDLSDCTLFYGDTTNFRPAWKGGTPPLKPGQKFHLHCALREADLYSFTC